MKQDKTLWYTAKKRRTQSRNYFRLGHWSPICVTQYAVNFPAKIKVLFSTFKFSFETYTEFSRYFQHLGFTINSQVYL